MGCQEFACFFVKDNFHRNPATTVGWQNSSKNDNATTPEAPWRLSQNEDDDIESDGNEEDLSQKTKTAREENGLGTEMRRIQGVMWMRVWGTATMGKGTSKALHMEIGWNVVV